MQKYLRMGLGKIYQWKFALLTLYVCFILPEATESTVCFLEDTSETKVIDDTESICCNGIIPKWDKSGRKRDCCNITETNELGVTAFKETIYYQSFSLCCGHKLHDIKKYKHRPECCGNEILLNKTSSFCCGNTLYQRSDEFDDCHESDDVQPFTVGRFEVVCERKTKNGTSRKIHRKKEGWDCCGAELIYDDNTTHFCYDDEIWRIDAVVSECGGEYYDKTRKVCCRNDKKETLIPIPKLDNTKYLGISPDYDCLDGKLIDKDKESIGYYKNTTFAYPKPFRQCGDTYYNPSNPRTQTDCCDGVVNSAKPGMKVACCGKEFIDTTKHICCNNTKIPVTSTLKCCGDRAYDRTSGQECCGTQLIGRSHLCCKRHSSIAIPIKKTEPGHNQCCGIKTYNTLEMECCAGNPMKLAPNQRCDRHTGQITNILDIYSNDLEDLVINDPNVILPGKNKDNMRRILAPDCPACHRSEPLDDCVKKFRYHVYIISVNKRGTNNTVMDVLVFDPPVRMTFYTNGKCNCFKKDTLYYFYTNRNIETKVRRIIATKARRPRKLQLRFTRRDIFSPLKGQYPSYAGTKRCRIDRYLKKAALFH